MKAAASIQAETAHGQPELEKSFDGHRGCLGTPRVNGSLSGGRGGILLRSSRLASRGSSPIFTNFSIWIYGHETQELDAHWWKIGEKMIFHKYWVEGLQNWPKKNRFSPWGPVFGTPNQFFIFRLPELRFRSSKACRTQIWSLWTSFFNFVICCDDQVPVWHLRRRNMMS